MPITKVDINTFDILLEGSVNNIRDFKFNSNNELGQTTHFLSTVIDPVIHNDGQLSSGIFNIYNNQEYENAFQGIDNVTNLLTDKMLEIKSIIYEKIQPEVDLLNKKIEEEKNSILTKEGINDYIENVPDLSKHFEIMNWVNPIIFGLDKKGVVAFIHDKLGIKTNKASLSNLLYDVTKFTFEGEPVYIQEDDYNTLVDDVNTEVCSCENCDCATALVETLFKPQPSKILQRNIINAWLNPKIASSSIYLNNTISLLSKILEVVSTKTLNLTATSKQSLMNNLSNMNILLIGSMYHILVSRETRLEDKLLLDKNVINGDLYKQFEMNNGTLENVYKFVKMNYNKISLPDTGITLSSVLSNLERTNERYIKWKNLQKENASTIIRNANLKAFRRVMTSYLDKFNVENIPQDYNLKNFLEDKKDLIDKSLRNVVADNNNILDSVYDVVVQCNYDKTEIPNILNMFRNELIELADSTGIISDEHADVALCSVMAEFMAKTLVEQFS